MDPMAAKEGQIIGAAEQATSKSDTPADVNQNLTNALAAVMAANKESLAAAKEMINDPNTPGNDKQTLSRAMPDFSGNVDMGGMNQMSGGGFGGGGGFGHGFDGDVNLSGMDALGASPVMAAPSLGGNQSVEQDAKSKGVLTAVVGNAVTQGTVSSSKVKSAQDDYSSWYNNAEKDVREIASNPSLPEAARQQLLDGLDGKVNSTFGADMSGMDPTKGALEKAILGVLATGGLPGSDTAKLQGIVQEQSEKTGALKKAVKQAVKDPSLNPTVKKELEEALAGRHNIGAAEVDLNSSSFAPLSHAMQGGLPGLGAGFMPGNDIPVTYNAPDAKQDDSLL